jgi:hypothetical protein
MIEIPKSIKNNLLYEYRQVKRSLEHYEQSIASQTDHLNSLQKSMDERIAERDEMRLFMSKNGVDTND